MKSSRVMNVRANPLRRLPTLERNMQYVVQGTAFGFRRPLIRLPHDAGGAFIRVQSCCARPVRLQWPGAKPDAETRDSVFLETLHTTSYYCTSNVVTSAAPASYIRAVPIFLPKIYNIYIYIPIYESLRK